MNPVARRKTSQVVRAVRTNAAFVMWWGIELLVWIGRRKVGGCGPRLERGLCGDMVIVKPTESLV